MGDLNSTFYTGPTQPQDPNAQAGVDLQPWVSSFAVEGRLAAKGTEVFGEYWGDGMVPSLALTGVGREFDPAMAKRCDFLFAENYK